MRHLLAALALAALVLLGAPARAQTINNLPAANPAQGSDGVMVWQNQVNAKGLHSGFMPLSAMAPGICPVGVGCTFPGPLALPVATVTAAGTTQGTAPVLTAQTNIVTAVPAGSGVALGTALPDQVFTVLNRGANALLVYPPAGAQIETAGANVGVMVAAGGMARFVCVSGVQCYAF